jgi:recombinational DNA repair protein RecT
LGVSSRLQFDDGYRNFLELAARAAGYQVHAAKPVEEHDLASVIASLMGGIPA